MAGIPDFPISIQMKLSDLNPTALITTLRSYHPRIQALLFLSVSVTLFGFSQYCKNHFEDEAMYTVDIVLFLLALIGIPKKLVRARQRLVLGIGEWMFALIKGVSTVVFFTFFHWLGKRLVADKDIYIGLATIFFFFHLILLRVVHEVSDDLGIAQGVLFAGYTVLLVEYPNLKEIVWISGGFTFLLAIMNTPQPPNHPAHEEMDILDDAPPPLMDDDDVEPLFPVNTGRVVLNIRDSDSDGNDNDDPAIQAQPSNLRFRDGTSRWELAQPKSTSWKIGLSFKPKPH